MLSASHSAFLDGVTGYIGRWALFWYLEELPDERVAVLIRPRGRGARAQEDAERRADQILDSIGMGAERHRVTVIPGDLEEPLFGNPEAIQNLRADTWLHIAGDVRFKKLGDRSSLTRNRDYTSNFIETAKSVPFVPRTVCHTSTFYVYEKSGSPRATYRVPEEFHDPGEMEHHNAYGYSKLEAEVYLQEQLRCGTLPFGLLIFRPDIVMHHIPVREVERRNPGLLTDDFKVVFELLAALIGQAKVHLPGLPSMTSPLEYVPVTNDTVLYTSDVDSVARAMMYLATLSAGDGLDLENGYRIFHLVNRWQPMTCGFLREVCEAIAPETVNKVQTVNPDEFNATILPRLSWLERMYYSTFIEPFAGYLTRPRTDAVTDNVDAVLGQDWHNLHPRHGIDLGTWVKAGAQQALQKRFGQA